LNVDEVIARTVSIGNATQANPLQTKGYLTDALGSIIATARQDQTPEAFYAYSPYGETQTLGVDFDSPTNSSQYAARENDGPIGGTNGGSLYYYRARYYDPVLKRFIAADPIGQEGGTNEHAYVDGNPISNIDPEGLWSFTISGYVPFLGPVGPGGAIIFGQNPNGSGFMTIRGGVGLLGGWKIDPNGKSPGYDPMDCSWGLSTGLYAGADFNAGPIYASLAAQRGWVVSGTRKWSKYHQPSATVGLRGRFSGINLTGSVAGQFTVFGGGNCVCGKQ
jgi:RHS repeat-associated protein